jgi:EAL domain-containing protein (putative c-di-GMP-specific phosphodiesterase class I)
MNAPSPPTGTRPVYTLDVIETSVKAEPPLTIGVFGALRLASHFQPIFSLAHGRVVGYEALLRASARSGDAVPPLDAFAQAEAAGEAVLLDRVCRTIHVRNFIAHPPSPTWLFLNVNPHVIADGPRYGRFFADLLQRYGVPPQRVVIEILEAALTDEAALTQAVEFYRELGCLIAIDDFGAGHSNFDRIWRLKPHIVKLDRSLIAQAARDQMIRLIMPRIASMIHEAGSLVLMEGVENEYESMIAMDSDVDFVQGNWFAPPAAALIEQPHGGADFSTIFERFQRVMGLERTAYQADIAPYVRAINISALQLKAGDSLDVACKKFLELPSAERCYVLDTAGLQITPSLLSPQVHAEADPRFAPVADVQGANWSRRHYFRRALSQPDRVHITRPYLSVTNALQCVTVSIAVKVGAEMRVLCGDIRWSEKFSASDKTIDTAMR